LVTFSTVPSGGNSLNGGYKTWSSGNGATARMNFVLGNSFNSCGLMLSDGTKYITWGVESSSGSAILRIVQWTNATTFSGQVLGVPNGTIAGGGWLRFTVSGGNRLYWFSTDGDTWTTFYSESDNTFLTATRVGVVCNPGANNQTGANVIAVLQHWAN
jgi:hypothetical protein